MTRVEVQALINEQQSIILECEGKLKATDYIAAKIAEGKSTKKEYQAQLVQRQQWRDTINDAQEEVARLETLEVDDEMVELPPLQQ